MGKIVKLFLFFTLTPFINAYPLNTDSLKQILATPGNITHPDKKMVKSAIVLSDYYTRISFDSAKYYAKLSRQLASRLGNKTGIAMAYNISGMIYTSIGYYDSALPWLDSALNTLIQLHDTTGIIFVQNNLAVAQMYKGNYAKALSYYQQNLTYAENNMDYENMLLGYNNMGLTYFDWKKYKEAREYYEKALNTLDKLGEDERKGSVYNNLGEVYRKMGDLDKAQFFFEKSYEINNKYGKQNSLLVTITNMGDIYFDKNNYSEALKRYRRALAISKKIPDDFNTSIINIKIGQVLNKLGQYQTAANHLKNGLRLAVNLELKSVILKAYNGLIENSYLIKNPDLIYYYHQKYTALNDSLFNDKNMKTVNELETKYKTAQKEREIAELTIEKKAKELEIQKQRNQKFYIIITVLIFLFIGYLLFNKYRIKSIKIRAALENDKLITEQRLFRSQMNPHFIFNSLNSIGTYIGTNNITEAQQYLTKFARLMRLILENSRKSSIALEDEIQTLRLYLELEKLRFEDRFEFFISIDNIPDTENIYVPPMLLQPFIENTIKHGFKTKTDKGVIKINFSKNKTLLVCVIEDNGIGREQSEKLKNQSLYKHHSLGTKVTEERFATLKKENELAGFTIIDLTDEKGNPTGTRVIVNIPFEED